MQGNNFEKLSAAELAQYIDHTLLKPDAQLAHIQKLCQEALENQFFSVCVNSSHVSTCAQLLKNSKVKIAAVVGFPLGAMSIKAKAFETSLAIQDGASEIDMVLPIGHLKDQNHDYVLNDIAAVVTAAKGNKVKVIFETSMLTYDEKILACQISKEAGAHFVKTSTGFGGGGATVEDVMLMKKVVGANIEVKASGGIKNFADAVKLLQAGATRLGTSSGVALVKGLQSGGGY